MVEAQASKHYGIGREGYGAYWPTLDEEGSYYINVYPRHADGSTGRETLVDELSADQALRLLAILEEAHDHDEEIEGKSPEGPKATATMRPLPPAL